MHRIVVLAVPDVVVFDLAIALQVFGGPEQAGRYAVTLAGPAPGPVAGREGVPVVASAGPEALAGADTVVVPGFAPRDAPAPLVEALVGAAGRGARMVSICSGAFALAAAGLLDGRRATTHWHHAAELAVRFPAVRVDPDVLYVDETGPEDAGGGVATSAGLAAGIDLCLHLLRRDHGADVAADAARRLVVAPHREGGQAQWLDRPLPPDGDGLAATCAWAREHLGETLSVADLARHAGHAPRTFARRFRDQTGTTPLRWLTAQRVAQARRLLERTDLTVDDIARRVGLGTAANLRLLVARDTHTSPSAYRRAHRGTTRGTGG